MKVSFVGEFFEKPRYQGGGSSHINAFRITSAQEALADYGHGSYSKGFNIDSDKTDDNLLAEALLTAKESDVCVIFAGLPERAESEGFDRKHLRLPDNQNTLISEIAKIQYNCVVVLYNGSPVEMPWLNEVAAVLEMYLGGEAVGGATADIKSRKKLQ